MSSLFELDVTNEDCLKHMRLYVIYFQKVVNPPKTKSISMDHWFEVTMDMGAGDWAQWMTHELIHL